MKKKTGAWLSKKQRDFAISFTLLSLAAFALIKILPLAPLNNAVAGAQQGILSSLGFNVMRDGTTLVVGNAAFDIVSECTGLVMIAIFLALLYSTGLKLEHSKIALYLAFFFVFNLARLAVTLAVGAQYGLNVLDVVHPVLWFVDSGIVFGAWAKEYEVF